MAEHTLTARSPAAASAPAGDRFLLRTARETVQAAGTGAALRTVEAAERALAAPPGGGPAAVAGVLPFDAGAPAHLLPAARLDRSRPVGGPPPAGAPPRWRLVRSAPDAAGFRRRVARALALLEDGGLAKLVLARALDYEADRPLDAAAVAARLAAREPDGHTFLVDVPGPATFVGASPELLVSRHGRNVLTVPLAGSAPRRDDPGADRAAARALLASAKDRYEHRIVVDEVVQRLRPLCRLAPVPAAPSLVATGDLWHLGTRIAGELTDPGVSALRLAATLHPTPAVCGAPTRAAAAAIAALEDVGRGWYAGAVGWTDRAGDGVWAVSLRCALIDGHRARLYAGCGIVPGSDAGAELAETTAKLRTVMAALGIEP